MKKKLIWAIVALVFGFLIFLAGSHYVGVAIITVGLLLADLYSDEKKNSKSISNDNNN